MLALSQPIGRSSDELIHAKSKTLFRTNQNDLIRTGTRMVYPCRWMIISTLVFAYAVSTAQAQGPGPSGGPGGGPGGGPSGFALIICNKSKHPVVFVSVGARVVEANDQTRVQGWWQISQSACVQIGTFPQPGFVLYARSPFGTQWAGSPRFQLCVNLNDRFDNKVSTGAETKQCPANQALVAFKFVEVAADKRTFTMNLD